MGPGEEEQGFSDQMGDVSSGDTEYPDQTYDTAGYDVPSDSGYENSMSYESDSGGVCYALGTEPEEPNASYAPGTEPGEPNACYEPGSDSEPTQAKGGSAESKQITVMYRLQGSFFSGSAIFCSCEHLSSGKAKEKLLVMIPSGEKSPKGIKVVYETSSCEKEVTRENLGYSPCPDSTNICM
jgi:hypothetical protein